MLRGVAIALMAGGAMFAETAVVRTVVVRAEEPYEAAAKQLSAATVTVTVRMIRAESDDSGGQRGTLGKAGVAKADGAKASGAKAKSAIASGEADAEDLAKTAKTAKRVERAAIGSGVAVGENLVVTAVRPDRGCQISLTMPGGRQAGAKLCVVDENSTLALLEVESLKDETPTEADAGLSHVSLCEKETNVGSRLLAASAWGAEPPLVSLGVLSGVDRFVPGAGFPPLVQCDVRTTETSLGAGIVNVNGELVGIVVACDGVGRNSRWTYAVSADHVRRLLEARREGQIVEIRRRRPHAGIELRQLGGSEDLVVRSVAAGGPAAKAGIEVGDVVATLDGRAANSVLEAARLVACRKPGDTVEILLRRGDRTIKSLVTLEPSEGEPTFSYAAKEHGERSRRADLADVPSKGEEEEPPGREIDTDGKSGLFEEFRQQLRQRDARISRLEAELAELRREISPNSGDAGSSAIAPAASDREKASGKEDGKDDGQPRGRP